MLTNPGLMIYSQTKNHHEVHVTKEISKPKSQM